LELVDNNGLLIDKLIKHNDGQIERSL
jgi:hypothetical protein